VGLGIEVGGGARLRIIDQNAPDIRLAGEGERLEGSDFVEDAALRVAADIAHGFVIADVAVFVDKGALHLNDAAEGCVGKWSDEDIQPGLSRSGLRRGGKAPGGNEPGDNEAGGRHRETAAHPFTLRETLVAYSRPGER
jgi:hypothetical protein